MNILQILKNAVFANSILLRTHAVLVRKRLFFRLTALASPLCPAAGMWTYFVIGRYAADAGSASPVIECVGMFLAAAVFCVCFWIMPWIGLAASLIVLFYGKWQWKIAGAAALMLNLLMCSLNGTLKILINAV